MDALTYALSQKIGIYYKDEQWKNKVFDDIVSHYPQDWLAERGICKSKYDSWIKLKDGTTIHFVCASESCRGCCFSKIILQPGINLEILRCVIAPTLKHQNRHIMILEDNDSLGFEW